MIIRISKILYPSGKVGGAMKGPRKFLGDSGPLAPVEPPLSSPLLFEALNSKLQEMIDGKLHTQQGFEHN